MASGNSYSPLHGSKGALKLGQQAGSGLVSMPVREWTVDETCDVADVMISTSQGLFEGAAGQKKCTAQIEFVYNQTPTGNPFLVTLGSGKVRVGSVISAVLIPDGGDASKAYTLNNAIVTRMGQHMESHVEETQVLECVANGNWIDLGGAQV